MQAVKNRIKARVRSKVSGTAERPRLAVKVSNRHIIAQLIDDTVGKTLAYTNTLQSKVTGSLTAKAEWVGSDIAERAKKVKITRVVFDRGTKIYHGRVKAVAEAARAQGMEF